MCTAISVTAGDGYFGRNLDFEVGFGEKIVITPRKFRANFTNGISLENHHAIIGMALPENGYPLYFDGVNEKGLGMAGLNFPDNARYVKKTPGKTNVASFEFIPWVLTQCGSVAESVKLLENTIITDEAFDEKLLPSPLHWIISDKEKTVTIEQTGKGFEIFDNSAGVLTNNPPFNVQMTNLANYASLTTGEPENLFSDKLEIKPYSRGMGAMGLPGDLSSASRFVRTCFLKLNSRFGETEEEKINQFFHILYSVYQLRGCVEVGDGFEITRYSSCCNTDKGIYYYTTYNNSEINAVDLYRENLDGENLITYDIDIKQKINIQNLKQEKR